MALFFRERAEDGAQDVRARSQVALAEAVADLFARDLRHRAKAFAEFRENGRAGRRDHFVRFVDLTERNALEDFQRGRSGDGEGAMRALDRAVAIMELGDKDLLDAERFDSDARTDDIRDRIERADFVELDVFRRLAVDLAFGDGNALENGERVLLHEIGELAVLD